MGKNIVMNSVCRSRRMCRTSLRDTEPIRCKDAAKVMLVPRFSPAILLGPRHRDENIFQARLGRMNIQALQAEVGQRACFVYQSMNRLAKDGRLQDAGPLPQPIEESRNVGSAGVWRQVDFQPATT